jgi:DNA adenine methylase
MSERAERMTTRPVLRYHGGKWRLTPWILSFFPAHRVYVEPFGGGASVLMRKPPAFAEVYNDLDGEVVNVFRVSCRIRGPPPSCAGVWISHPMRARSLNARTSPSDEPVERARRIIIRAFMGHGATGTRQHRTGFRRSTSRRGTVPATDWAGWPSQVPLFCDRLRGVVIEECDAFEVMPHHDGRDTLFYVDPPYVHSTRVSLKNGHKHHYRSELTDDDHRRLAMLLKGLAGSVVLSGYDCELYTELYSDWERHSTSALADGARKRTEVVWLNAACRAALDAGRSQYEMVGTAEAGA